MVRPYYQDSAVTIYHGDCRDVLPDLEPIDLLLTDPPYNLGIEYTALTNDKREDYRSWCVSWFYLSEAKTKAISCGIANLSMWCSLQRPDWCLCWHKPFSVSHGAFGFSNWEPVLVFGKTGKNDRQSDYFSATYMNTPETNGHPCPKPLAWAKGALSILSKSGSIVCDCFMGTGTTLRAAKDLNRKAIGIEIEERYCEIAASRMSQEVLAL